MLDAMVDKSAIFMKNVRRLLKQLGWKDVQLAEALGTSQQQVSAMFHGGKNVGPDMEQRFLRVFPDKNLAWFYTEHGEDTVNMKFFGDDPIADAFLGRLIAELEGHSQVDRLQALLDLKRILDSSESSK